MRKLIALTFVALAATSVVAQSLDSARDKQKPASLRTPDGKPDLQGIWSNATITPLERPQNVTNLVLSQEEATRMERATLERRERLNQPSDPDRPAPPKGGDGSTGAAGNVGGYNNFWLDPGERVAVVDGQRRSSLIIDPPNGRIPALTDAARARQGARLKMMAGRGQYDHPEFRPLAERCLLSFGPTTPLVPNYFYNNNIQIVQTPDHVMILMEMVHDARIVRLNATTHLPKHIRPWMGDSIGRWEGDTLVVDTTNFPPQQNFRGASENLHVVERFRRVDANTINYRFTVDDPTTFTAPFSGEIPFRAMDELIYEYACHEGNYALSNVLSGARNEEKRLGTKQEKQ
jgi:hypothetical protein